MSKVLSGDERFLRNLGFTLSDPVEEAKAAEAMTEVKAVEPKPAAKKQESKAEPAAKAEAPKKPAVRKSEPKPKQTKAEAPVKEVKAEKESTTIVSIRVTDSMLEKIDEAVYNANRNVRKRSEQATRTSYIIDLIKKDLGL